MAKDVSQRATDQKQIEEYTAHAKFFTSRAQALGSVMKGDVPNTSFDDIKGLEKIKNLAKSFIFMARNSNLLKYYKIEGGLGLLMYGAPGTGKTMFAEAIAHEMNLPLFVVTPADIFKSYVGASEQAVREIFNEIDQCPDGAILFVDECESIFSMRTSDTKDYKSAVTTELLQRINGFGVDGSKRIMIGATNRPDLIDSAYLRYKRFSHLIHVTPPDREAKDAIIRGKLKGIALEAGLTYEEILDMTEKTETVETENGAVTRISAYYSAADLCGALEEACRLALEKIEAEGLHNPIPVTRDMFKAAFTKIVPSISAELLEEYDNFRKNK
jgi:transitional endoplasmic reticulum ATPase